MHSTVVLLSVSVIALAMLSAIARGEYSTSELSCRCISRDFPPPRHCSSQDCGTHNHGCLGKLVSYESPNTLVETFTRNKIDYEMTWRMGDNSPSCTARVKGETENDFEITETNRVYIKLFSFARDRGYTF